eukprot:UN07582
MMMNDPKSTEIIQKLKLLTNAQKQQLQYVNLMHSYMIIEIAYWRKMRRLEINRCIKSYAVAMRDLCQERVGMWFEVEEKLDNN